MTTIIITLIVLALIIFLVWRWNTQPTIISNTTEIPQNFPTNSFSHQSFAELLTRFVNEKGNVDYQLWFEDESAIKQLDQYLAAVAKFSPENAQQRFKHKNDRLGYWVYSYNAQVIRSILDNWPLSSVTDLKAPLEIVQGLGFFYKRKFIFGGQAYSLYQVENSKIFDGEGDPRVHFILNCGSGSCPVLRPQLPLGDALEPFLKQSAIDFIEDTKHLKIDHDQQILYLSTIFKWYKNDFLKVVNRNQDNPQLIHYLQSISSESFLPELVKSADYSIVYIEYDWDINKVKNTNKPINNNKDQN